MPDNKENSYCPHHQVRSGSQGAGERPPLAELPFEHQVVLYCKYANTEQQTIILANIKSKYSDQKVAVTELNATFDQVGEQTDQVTFSCSQSDLNQRQLEAPDTLANITANSHPEERIARLSEPSKDLNGLVNEQCDLVSDSEILDILAGLPDHTRGGKLKIYWVEECLEQVFGLAFDRTLAGIGEGSEKMNYLSVHIDGSNTFAKSVSALLTENKKVVPFIISGIIRKAWGTTGWRVLRVVDQIVSYGVSGLNDMVYGMRIGKNGAVGNDYPITSCFDITHLQGRIEQISLNSEVAQKKAEDIKTVNKNNALILENLQKISAAADRNGMQILFDKNHFGFNYGPQAPCPVTYADKSRGNAYLPQVQLAVRVLWLIGQYHEQHKPSMPVRLTAALLHQTGKLLKLPIRNLKRNRRKFIFNT